MLQLVLSQYGTERHTTHLEGKKNKVKGPRLFSDGSVAKARRHLHVPRTKRRGFNKGGGGGREEDAKNKSSAGSTEKAARD